MVGSKKALKNSMLLELAPRRGIEPRANRLTETLDAEKSIKINDL